MILKIRHRTRPIHSIWNKSSPTFKTTLGRGVHTFDYRDMEKRVALEWNWNVFLLGLKCLRTAYLIIWNMKSDSPSGSKELSIYQLTSGGGLTSNVSRERGYGLSDNWQNHRKNANIPYNYALDPYSSRNSTIYILYYYYTL